MSPSQWERIQEIYHRLSELPENDREAALVSECGDDQLVGDEVRELLRSAPTGELDRLVQQVAYDVASQGHERVGPYRLEREIGRGGMGTVYLGVRDDNEFHRKVAIKFLNLGMDRPEYLKRFRQERQILADLEHPHIARLIEGGQSSTGLPYLVMEYVDGKPLFDYCREYNLSREGKLELVAKICDAVQYAHSNLVVHRDLKPSNILVTAEGIPKLLDFGIAKVLEGNPGEAEPLTRATGQLLTMDYASPEQIQGESISTVSDVYSLGVILYELLAGARPFKASDSGPMAYKVLHVEPPKPSARAEELGLAAVPAELDNVVMKAMAKEPSRRYRSASALAEDIRRHLVGQPVLAHGESTWYVASKFVRRHRIAAALAGILAVAVVALGVQLAVTNGRLAKERDLAIHERRNAREVSNFMVELFGNSGRDTNSGSEITAREMLDLGAQRLRRAEVEDPEVRANLQVGIGAAYQRLGRWEDARIQLEEALQLLGSVSESAVNVRVEALMEYSNLLDRVGDPAAAEAAAREMVQLARHYHSRRLPLALSTLANSYSHQMKHAEAEQIYREGLSLESAGPSSTIPLKANLAVALFRQGKFDEAHALLKEVRQLVATHWGQDQLVLGILSDTLGNLEGLRGNYSAALAAFDQEVSHFMDPTRPDNPHLAHPYCGQAETYLRMGDPESAEKPLAACASIRAAATKPDSFDAMVVLQLQGWRDLQLENPRAAEAKFRRALDVHEQNFGKLHATRAKGLRFLGMAKALAGDTAEAELHFKEAIELWHSLGLAEDPEFAELMLEAGKAAMADGRFAEAEPRLRLALQIRERLRMSPGLVEATKVHVARSLHAQGKREEARRLAAGALQQYSKMPPEVRGQVEEARALLARMEIPRGDE